MESTKLSSKGQVIIPKAVRDARGWDSGTTFDIEETADGIILRARRTRKPTTLDEVSGCLQWKGPAKTLKEMDEAITAEAKRRARR